MNLPTTFLSDMSRREKRLAAAIGALLLLMAGTRGYHVYQTAVEQHQAAQLSAEQTLSGARLAIERGHRARNRMLQWRNASLPANHDIARSLYQDWLRQELTKANIQVKELRDITSNARISRTEQTANYRPFTFSVHAQATLEGLTKFLQQFYGAPHLHTISTVSLKPVATPKSTDSPNSTNNNQKLDIVLTMEAIAVPGCRRTDQLASSQEGPNLSEPDADGAPNGNSNSRKLEQILKTIQDRNIFATYQSKKDRAESTEKAGPSDNAAQQAKISGLTQGGGGWRLAVHRKDTGRTLYFRTGDRIHIGQFKGTIASMDGRQVVIDTTSEKRTLRLGQSLME